MTAIDPEQKKRWLHEFRFNGFVVLRDFLPKDLVEAMHAQLLPLVRGEYQRILREGLSRLRAAGRLSLDVSRYADLLGGPIADDLYRRNPAIEEMAEAILAPTGPWERGWSQVECVFKGSEYMSWHPDQKREDTPQPDEPHRTRRLTFNIALVDFTWANGAMEMVPTTHLHPRGFLEEGVLDLPNLYAIRLPLTRGDCVLRDGKCLHRGAPNLTDEPRLMLDQTYRLTRIARVEA